MWFLFFLLSLCIFPFIKDRCLDRGLSEKWQEVSPRVDLLAVDIFHRTLFSSDMLQVKITERSTCFIDKLLPLKPIHLLYSPCYSFAPKQATMQGMRKMHILEIPDLEKKCISAYPQFPSIFRISPLQKTSNFFREIVYMHFSPLQKKTSKMYMHFLWYKKCMYTTKTVFFLKKTVYMHFFGWPRISKICIFLGKMHIFQDPGLEKNAYTQFPENLYMHFLGWPGISKICIFLGKMHIFQDPGLEKKCIYTISRKICICIFWGGLESHRKMHIFEDPGLEKKCIYTISRKICICIFLGGLESQKYAFS